MNNLIINFACHREQRPRFLQIADGFALCHSATPWHLQLLSFLRTSAFLFLVFHDARIRLFMLVLRAAIPFIFKMIECILLGDINAILQVLGVKTRLKRRLTVLGII